MDTLVLPGSKKKAKPSELGMQFQEEVEISTVTLVKGADLETKNDNFESWDEVGRGEREMFFLWGFKKAGLRSKARLYPCWRPSRGRVGPKPGDRQVCSSQVNIRLALSL